MIKCTLTYFKDSGKYYGEGFCEVEAEHMFQVQEKIRVMLARGQRPGLCDGFGFIAHVTTDHPMDVPFLVMPRTSDRCF